MSAQPILHCIGYASGIAAALPSCCMGPVVLQPMFTEPASQLPPFVWQEMLYAPHSAPQAAALPAVATISEQLAHHTTAWASAGERFLVLGGDHTAAIGAWSGAAHGLAARGDLGLIWIDAHMDSHTPENTVSHNLHGMPLAVLLGYGYPQLTQLMDAKPKLLPRNVCLVGVRDFEAVEYEFLKQLGVKIIFIDEVKQHGVDAVIKDAIAHVTQHSVGYGVSIDIDAIDPIDAPATGAPAPDGIPGQALRTSLRQLYVDTRFIGLEISEFDPSCDVNQKTEQLIGEIVATVFSEEVV